MRIVVIGLVIGFATLVAALAAAVAPSEAQTQTTRPWCVEEVGTGGRGMADCSYHTFAQCQESARGTGWCVANPKLGWERREQQQRRQDGQRR